MSILSACASPQVKKLLRSIKPYPLVQEKKKLMLKASFNCSRRAKYTSEGYYDKKRPDRGRSVLGLAFKVSVSVEFRCI